MNRRFPSTLAQAPGRKQSFARRKMLATLALVAAPLAIGSTAALAQSGDFPNRAVTFVVPFPAGGNLDIFARAVALNLADIWKVPVLVDNRPGAGGMIGADRVAKAKDEGYTLLFTNTSVIVTGLLRSSLLPNTPTFREAGFAGLEPVGWYGVFAPAGTPKAVVAKLSRDFNASLTKPDIQAKLKDFVVRGTGTTPEEFAHLIVGEDKIWRGLIEKFGIKAE